MPPPPRRSGAARQTLPASTPLATAFSDLGLGRSLAQAVHAAGYTEPTPIQSTSIPKVLDGRDLLGCAQTGTGKTAAFALPLLETLLRTGSSDRRSKPRGIQVLVLAPTRELASQIEESFRSYACNTKLRSTVIFGGVGKQPQITQLRRGVEVLVATPGRLLDLETSGYVDLSSVRHFVLDEADRMLDMGFVHDVRRISQRLPKSRQTLLFSATMPKAIRKLAGELLSDPIEVAVDPVSSASEPIEQMVVDVEKADKVAFLSRLLQTTKMDSTLVFTRTKHGANRLAKKLERVQIRAAAIHGNKSQGAREQALAGFRDGSIRVLVATDIAARGIDVDGISHVVNYELPNEPESYVHRIGRTGRAGRSGQAIALCSTEERSYLRDIERLIGQRIDRVSTSSLLGSTSASARVEQASRTGGSSRKAATKASTRRNSTTASSREDAAQDRANNPTRAGRPARASNEARRSHEGQRGDQGQGGQSSHPSARRRRRRQEASAGRTPRRRR